MSSEPLQVTDDDEMSEDLTLEEQVARNTERLEQLDQRVSTLENWYQNVWDNRYKPMLNTHDEQLTILNENSESSIASLTERLDSLEAQMRLLSGVSEKAATTPVKRAQDIAQVMVTRLAVKDRDAYAMNYNEITTALAERGHGEIYPAQATRVMDDLAEDAPGFEDGTKWVDGQEYRAITVKRDALPFEPSVNGNNNVYVPDQTVEPADSPADD